MRCAKTSRGKVGGRRKEKLFISEKKEENGEAHGGEASAQKDRKETKSLFKFPTELKGLEQGNSGRLRIIKKEGGREGR